MTDHDAPAKPQKKPPVIIEAMAPPDERPVPHTTPPDAPSDKTRPSKVEGMAPPERAPLREADPPPEEDPTPDAKHDEHRSPDGPGS